MQPIQNSIDSFSKADLSAMLKSRGRTIAFRYELLDSNLGHKRWLDKVTSASVEFDATRPVRRTANISLVDQGNVLWGKDLIKPWVYVSLDRQTWAGWPLGVFSLPFSAVTKTNGGNLVRTMQCPDLSVRLVDEQVHRRYEVPQGTNIADLAVAVIRASGVPRVTATPTTLITPRDMEWEPGTRRIDILNEVLEEMNYHPVYFDEHGVARVEQYIEPDDRPISATYDFSTDSVVKSDVESFEKLSGIPNKWVVISTNSDNTLTSVYVNDSPTSPTSTVNLGRTITSFRRVSDAPNQATLDEMARRMAIEDTEMAHEVTFTTAIMPNHGVEDCIYLDFGSQARGKFEEIRWSMDLATDGSMTHTARKVFTP